MKRSLINNSIEKSIWLLEEYQFRLPDFAYFSVEEWRKNTDRIGMIKHTMLGWDVTDFGNGDFDTIGSVLFTLRNGDVKDPSKGTPYAEKLIILSPGQRLPLHMHAIKTEDIINRGGGVFFIKLYNANEEGKVDYESLVEVYCDGIKHVLKAGEELIISSGNSITLTPTMYHSFWCGEKNDVIIGEVSSVNDDKTDNIFAEEVQRFSVLEEDEEAEWILCNEYNKFLNGGFEV